MTLNLDSILKKLLAGILVIVILIYAKGFLMPLVIGGILATLFLPFCNKMERIGLGRILSVFISLFGLLAVFGIIISLLSWKISELFSEFDLLKSQAIKTFNQTQAYLFQHFGISLEKQSEIFNSEKPSISGLMKLTAGSLKDLMTNLILILAYFFFLLYSRVHIKQFFLKLAKKDQQNEVEQILKGTTRVSQQYLLGLAKMIVCLWILYSIGFSIIGVKNAVFFAILCGLLEIIPFIGNITGTTITVLIAALHGGNITLLLGIVITYGIVQFVQGWVLEPLILGPQVKINPLFTIIALIVGDWIWGISGILLAIPVAAMMKIVCDHIEPLKPYGFLIGEMDTQEKSDQKVKNIFKKIITKAR
ncbi:MAG TPA: AI-2E family transporter [Leadbetterella sp.]|nr:AI-2E family transporter [Leadbetterella sp.]